MIRCIWDVASGFFWGSVAGCVVAGCGAPENEWRPEGPRIEDSVLITPGSQALQTDIGQGVKPLIVPGVSSVNQVGFMLDGTLRQCVASFSAQNCWVQHGASDGKKRLRYFISGSSAAGRGRIRAALQDYALAMFQNPNPGLRLWDIPSFGNDGWDISEATSNADPLTTVVFRAEPDVAGVCTGSTGNITKYICWSSERTRGLTEHGLVGNYHTSVDIPVAHVDDAEIQSTTFSTVQKNRVMRQAVWALADQFGGHGLVSGTSPACTSLELVTSQLCKNPDSQACIMNNAGDNGAQDDLTQLGPVCGL